MDELDVQGISLLSEIFPDASKEELEDLHFQRVEKVHELSTSHIESCHDDDVEKDNEDNEDEDCFINQQQEQQHYNGRMTISSNESISGGEELHVINRQVNENRQSTNIHTYYDLGLDGGRKMNGTLSSSSSTGSSSGSCSNDTDNHILNDIKGNESNNTSTICASLPPLGSPLGKRIFKMTGLSTNNNNNDLDIEWHYKLKDCLTDDFLRIPKINTTARLTTATKSETKKHEKQNKSSIHKEMMSNFERNVISATFGNDDEAVIQPRIDDNYDDIITVTLYRDMYVGLGLQICEWNTCIYVNALLCHNGNIISSDKMYHEYRSLYNQIQNNMERFRFGPAFNGGIHPGDRIIGINGKPFILEQDGMFQNEIQSWTSMKASKRLSIAAQMISDSCDPIVLHILRSHKSRIKLSMNGKLNSTMQQKNNDLDNINLVDDNEWQVKREHQSLSSRIMLPKLVHPLAQALSSKGVIKSGYEMKVSEMLAQYTNKALMWKSNFYLRGLTSGTLGYSQTNRRSKRIYPVFQDTEDTFDIEESSSHMLEHSIIRQALVCHVVNACVDDNRLAFTIWVYDVESQTDWYAPVRFFQDFKDLRSAVSCLHKSVERIPFPNYRWFHESEASSSQSFREARCRELELFLREVCSLIYKHDYEPSCISEIALYVQTFLGCDTHIKNQIDQTALFNKEVIELGSAVQLYTYRILLLPSMVTTITQFILGVKKRIVESDRSKTVSKTSDFAEKDKITSELSRINQFFTSIVKLILESCSKDFDVMVHTILPEAEQLSEPRRTIQGAVRQQVEMHTYVPLRSVLSRIVVLGWRNEDNFFSKKQQQLQRKNQFFFKIKGHHQSPSHWQSVVDILQKDVSQSTLPCVKLNAIVRAGKEIGRLSLAESREDTHTPLGADDFLPIFIYCVVRAKIKKPSALNVLLRNLCDNDLLLGEVGYYLSSFEAVIAYIHEIDLSKNS